MDHDRCQIGRARWYFSDIHQYDVSIWEKDAILQEGEKILCV